LFCIKYLRGKIKKLNLKDRDKKDLAEFMKAGAGDFPQVETDRLPKRCRASLKSFV